MTEGHAERTHRRYSPSQADRIALCPGSTKLLDRVPPRGETEWSIEGTKAHIVLQAALENRVRDARIAHLDYSELCMEALDARDDGPYTNFYSSINRMLEEVYDILDQFPDAILWTETYVEPPSTVAPGDVGGYCDVAIYVPSINRLWVFDYKHGAGVTKSVEGNRQVLQYGAGSVYDPMSPLNARDDSDREMYFIHQLAAPLIITLVIVQPRAFHAEGVVRAKDVSALDLWTYLQQMDDAIVMAEADEAPLVPGEEQCRFCDAKVECPARQTMMLSSAQTHFNSVRDVLVTKLPSVDLMTPDDFAWGSFVFPLMEKYIKEFYERRNELMRSGLEVPGYKLVEVDPKRDWFGAPAAIAPQLAALIGCTEAELWREPKFITLTEAENMVVKAYRALAKRGSKDAAAEDARKAFAVFTDKKPTGSITIVEASDPRPSIMAGAANFATVAGLIAPPTGE